VIIREYLLKVQQLSFEAIPDYADLSNILSRIHLLVIQTINVGIRPRIIFDLASFIIKDAVNNVVRFLANYRLARRKVVPKLKDLAIIEGRIKALINATDDGRRCLVELIGEKAKLKLAYERLISECESHFDSVPDGNNFQVE
jgi:hypothetical protein